MSVVKKYLKYFLENYRFGQNSGNEANSTGP